MLTKIEVDKDSNIIIEFDGDNIPLEVKDFSWNSNLRLQLEELQDLIREINA